MNVCTFVGEITSLVEREWVNDDFCWIQLKVPEHYTNSRGERKVDYTSIKLHVFSTAAKYLEKNARDGDNIAVRAMYKNDHEGGYFRINEFKLLKDRD